MLLVGSHADCGGSHGVALPEERGMAHLAYGTIRPVAVEPIMAVSGTYMHGNIGIFMDNVSADDMGGKRDCHCACLGPHEEEKPLPLLRAVAQLSEPPPSSATHDYRNEGSLS